MGEDYSHRGLGIHVSARVMGKFAIFCPGYGSSLANLTLLMGLLFRDLPSLWVIGSNL